MRDALNATGRPIVYSVHSSVTPGTMQPSLANFWRTGPDIGSSYEQVLDRAMIANNVSAYLPAGPGGWADPDMLVVRLHAIAARPTLRLCDPPEQLSVHAGPSCLADTLDALAQVGNIGHGSSGSPPSLFPDAEGRTQFALWCLLKAPLLIGTFIHNITEGPTLATLTAKAAIAVNQDALGEPGVLRRDGGWAPDKPRPTTNKAFGFQLWSGALSGGRAAAVLANLEPAHAQTLTLATEDLPRSRAMVAKWDVEEAFSGKVRRGVNLPETVSVPPHDVAMWVLTPSS